MQGQVQPILSVYDSASRQLIIPVYQRNYDWKEAQCERLFDDLVLLHHEQRESHFFGAVVADSRDAFQWIIIDGQQRITTTSLLLLALAHSLEEGIVESKDSSLATKIRASLLETADKNSAAKFKLKPIKNDAAAYQKLFMNLDPIEDSNITRNYRYFLKRIAKNELSGDELWQAVNNLQAMILTLGRDDDPQRIFESLNSTGLSLSEADKIRNIVLMGADPKQQELLYNNYWNEIENFVSYRTDWFIRHFLTLRTRKTPRQDAVYEAFRTYQKDKDVTDVLSDMHTLAKHTRDLLDATTGEPAADRRLKKFNILSRDVTLPFLIAVLGEYREQRISGVVLAEIIKIVDSYIFRRFVCGVPTNSMNKTFATLFADAMRIKGDASLDEVVAYLLTRRSDGSTRFPSDEEFSSEFSTRNMYKITAQNRNYLYECLENLESNDTRDIASALEDKTISIEHIMPQTLSSEWEKELGPDAKNIHETWLHRIGNLTITGYNAMYSNRSYEEKRKIKDGFLDSPYSLNKTMKAHDTWGLAQLEERTELLCTAALSYWARPSTSFKPRIEPLPQEPLGEETSFRNRRIVAFEFHGTRRTVSTWKTATIEIVRMVSLEHPEGVKKHAAETRNWSVEEHAPKDYSEIAPGLHILSSSNTDTRIATLRRLFDALGLDKDELIFTLSKDTTMQEEPAVESPFAQFTMFEPQLEELSDEAATADDAAELLNELSAAAADLREGDATPVGHLTITDVAAQEFIDSAEINDLLWSLARFEELDNLYPGKGMLAHLRNGTLLRIVQAVAKKAQ